MNSNSLKLLLPISLGVFAFAQIGIRISPQISQEHVFFAWLTLITLPIGFIGLIAFFALRKQTIPAAQPTPTPLPPRPPQSATVHEIRIPRTKIGRAHV